ncbi:MAG TPA: GNAT family N-acetyltransferase [Pararobbsia sp.]|nr:GNAT family N-acetyltransferase [Pararobbsia sp.]
MNAEFLASRVFDEREAHWQQKMAEWDPAHGDIRIVELNGLPIAFITIVDDHEPQYGVYVDHLHVLPGHQGVGAGKRLLAHAERWARARDVRQLHLLAWEANLPARGFYEHLGWRCVEKFEDQLVDTRALVCRYIVRLDN